VDFSEAKDLSRILFQIPGPNCEIRDSRLILEKMRGLSAKCWKMEFLGIIFMRKKSRTRSTGHGPHPASVHYGPAMDGGTELTGAWPPAALVSKGTGQGTGEGEWDAGNSVVCSPELGRQ
jgi:hypothetical protein